MFTWFDWLGLGNIVSRLRHQFSLEILPDWFIYSLPNGLWTYSLTSVMILIRSQSNQLINLLWILSGLLLSLLFEIGQATKFVRGTFDVVDIFVIIISFILSLFNLVILKKLLLYKKKI